MMKSFVTLLLAVFAYSSYAQQSYMVTPVGDTLSGKIQILLPSEYHEEILLENNGDNKKYKAYQFRSFYYENHIYKPVKLGNKYKIMRMEKPGYLSLLTYRMDDNYDFGSKYLLKKSGEGVELPTFLFRKTMTDFLEDCKTVTAKIEDKTYKRGDLDKIIEEYNQCIILQTQETYSNLSESKPLKTTSNPVGTIIKNIQHKLADLNINNNELTTLLSDIENKYLSGAKIPSYMIEALKEQTADLQNIQEEVNQLLKVISN